MLGLVILGNKHIKVKKFTQKGYLARLSEKEMPVNEFNEWMDNELNWNKDKTLNNTKKHASHWNVIRELFNDVHTQNFF